MSPGGIVQFVVSVCPLDGGSEMKPTVMNFRTSSMASTGALRSNTACHSVQFSGVIAKRVCKAKKGNGQLRRKRGRGAEARTHREEGDVEDSNMQRHAERNRRNEEGVLPER